MRTWQHRLLLPILALTMAAAPVTATEQGCGGDASAALRKAFPNYKFREVNPTPIAGLFEVVSKENIVYFAPASGHLIFGEIWSRDGQNLTALSREQHTGQEIAALPLDKAVRIGSGAATVIEFTDPDCPFCRKGAAFFKERPGVSRYIFFAPLTGLHPGAAAKAEFILSAPDPARAYEEVMAGRYDNRPLPSFTDRGLLAEHLQIAARLGIKSTPRYWINTTPVNGFNPERLTALLDAGREQNQQTTQRTPSR